MRDCLFLVADKTMGEMLKGLFSRPQYHQSLGCSPFNIETEDIIVAGGLNDPGVYKNALGLLRPFRNSHRHVIVILDAAWDGSPGAQEIAAKINQDILDAGWAATEGATIVIEPELENWVWQDSIHVCNGLGYLSSFDNLKNHLSQAGLWPIGNVKPPDPKEAILSLLRHTKKPFSSAIYKDIASRVTFAKCQDPSFLRFLQTLRSWFPM